MATYVLVHGAWAGGWCWGRVAPALRSAGHDIRTPTLTGQGDRAHQLSPEVGVDTHVQDVVATLHYEDLTDVVLVGHSYAGSVISAVAEEAGDRIARLVYVDGFVPSDGTSTFDCFPPEFREHFRGLAEERGDGWRIPGDEGTLDIWQVTDPAHRAWVGPRLTAFPLRAFEQPLKLPTDAAASLPRTYVACTEGPARAVFDPFAARARDEGWEHHDLATGHACWVTAPDELARILLRATPAT